MDRLLRAIKRAAVDAVNASDPCCVYIGTVESRMPLRINVGDRFCLNANLLTMANTASPIKDGSEVILLRVQGGRKYILLDTLQETH
jgi:hypothetical protein